MREREELEEERFRQLDEAIRGNLKRKNTIIKKWTKKNRQKPDGFSYVLCKACCGLFFADSSCRTNSCTSSAANARTCIDNELAVSLADSAYWTFWFASSTANA